MKVSSPAGGTSSPATKGCACGCGRPVPRVNRYGGELGRPAVYADENCRKAAYRARRRHERLAEQRRLEELQAGEDRRRRLELVAELAALCTADPAYVVEWIRRRPEREWPLQDLLTRSHWPVTPVRQDPQLF